MTRASGSVDLGAEVLRVPASDVIAGLEQAVKDKGATHLFLARDEARGLKRFTERPLPDRLIDRMPHLDVHLVGAPTPANGADSSR